MAIINGTSGNDTLDGTAGTDTIHGLAGNDWLRGLGGNDSIDGGDGADLLDGGAGQDTVIGGAGDDWLEGGPDNDSLYGGAGIDYAVYDSAPSAVHIDLEANHTSGGDGSDFFDSIEGIVGSNFDDTLDGNWDNNDLMGGAGNDLMEGFGATDYFDGGAGTDTMLGGAGDDFFLPGFSHDVLDGGEGLDAVYYEKNRDQYTMAAHGSTLWIADASGVPDYVSNIELLEFKDRFYVATTFGDGLVAANLASTLFGDGALHDGTFDSFYNQMKGGATPEQVAADAVASARFAQVAGSHSNDDFVDHMFASGASAPDSVTQGFFLGMLDAGQSQGAIAAMMAARHAPVVTDLPQPAAPPSAEPMHVELVGAAHASSPISEA